MTPWGIEPTTFQFVTQFLNQLLHPIPPEYKFYDAHIFSVHIKIKFVGIIWIYLKDIIVLDITIVAYHHNN
jgi:hypothetical protein